MGERRLNGIDAAVALLGILTQLGGGAGKSVLMRATDLSRTSLHRILHTLAEQGIVAISRGHVEVGPIAQALYALDSRRMRLDLQHRKPAVRAVLPRADANSAVALSPPKRMNRPTRRLKLGFSNASLDNPWRVALVHAAEHAASASSDRIARMTIRHADGNAARQSEDIRMLVEDGADGLIVSAIPSPEVSSAIEAAALAGVEIVMVDRRLPDARPTSFVSTSDDAIGEKTALWMAETLCGKGSLLLLPGVEGVEPAQVRLNAARRVFSRYPGIDIVDTIWTGWLRKKGFDATTRALSRSGRRIHGVWCDSGLQGVGSMEAFLSAGYRTGEIPPHTGGDLNVAYKLAIRHEIKLAAVDYPPAMGFRAVEVLLASLRGRHVPRRLDVATDLVLTRNAALAAMQPQAWADEHVRWDMPDDLVLASGLGRAYNPRAFRIHYPGNSYNRSAASSLRGDSA